MPETNGDPPVDASTLVVLVFSATAGVLVEFYDFFIYGYAAASAFPTIFFPRLPATQALVFSYLAFAAGFPARLLGALLFGHFGDRFGRKFAFLANIAIVGLTTCLTGLLPGYAKLGAAAPILLVVLRIIQGVGLGGEFGGASALLAEFAAQRQSRAFWISLATLGIPLGGISATAVLLLLNKSFQTTGWRLAMLLSGIVVVPALLARNQLADTPMFERLKQGEAVAKLPSFSVFKSHPAPIVLIALVCAFQQMDGYVGGTYVISFMKLVGIPLGATATLLLIARIADVAGIVLSGPGADVLKRRNTAFIAITLTTALSFPFLLSILGRHTARIAIFQCLLTFFGIGVLHGLAPILAAESFPTKYRYSGTGISYNLSAMLGGMIAPPVLAALVGVDAAGKWFYVPVVYTIYGVIAMLALWFLRETRGVVLEELDAATGTIERLPDPREAATSCGGSSTRALGKMESQPASSHDQVG